MKKLLFIFIIIFLFIMNLQSQEIGEDGVLINEDLLGFTKDGEHEEGEETEAGQKVKKPRKTYRSFEIGFLNLDIGFGNNFIGLGDIFQEKIVIDFQNFEDQFSIGFDMNVKPLFFNINMKERWGFGMDIARISVYGNMDISGNLLQFKKTDGDDFGVGAAAFVDVGIPAFFHVGKIMDKEVKINARLAGYVPIVYTEPDMRYSFKDSRDGSKVEIEYGLKVLSLLSFNPDDDMMSSLDIGKSLGMDFSIGAEYPLTHILRDKVDMDVGIEFTNIPLFPSGLSHYMEMNGKVGIDSSKIKIQDLIDGKEYPKGEEPWYYPEFGEDEEMMTYGSGDRYNIFRPFRMMFTGKYRPLKMNPQLLTLYTGIGFSINPIFADPASFELDMKATCNLKNLFKPTVGMAYESRMWKQSIDLVLDAHFVELNFGVAMQSQDFFKSWAAHGLRVKLGAKFGG